MQAKTNKNRSQELVTDSQHENHNIISQIGATGTKAPLTITQG